MQVQILYPITFLVMMASTVQSAWLSTSLIGNNKIFHYQPDVSMNWWNAHRLCRQNGFELSSIDSAAEFSELKTLLSERGTPIGKDRTYWTSGSDASRPVNHFTWMNNGQKFTFASWKEPNPDNWRGFEDFVEVRHYSSDGSIHFNDVWDLASNTPICETNLNSLMDHVTTGVTYHIPSSQKLNWFDAHRYCRSNNMRLASIRSQAEFHKFKAAVMSSNVGSMEHHESTFWTSGTDKGQTAGSFFWFSNGAPLTFALWSEEWSAKQPDNVCQNGECEDCLEVRFSSPNSAFFNDRFCSHEAHFVCEHRQ